MRIDLAAVARTLPTVAVLLVTGCAAPPRPVVPAWDVEFARLNETARAAYERGSLPTACTLYEQALAHARALDAAAEIGDSAYNLAACRMALGEDEQARVLLREAEAELTRAKADLADVLLVAAKLARRQGRREDARRFAEQVLFDPGSVPTDSQRAEVALLQGGLACEDGDGARAKVALEEATRQISALCDVQSRTQLRAAREKVAGRIRLLEKRPAEAAECFDREAEFLQRARQASQMAHALLRSGESWRDAGQPAVAADRFFRAARSRFAQGHKEEAMKSVELSLELAAEAGDDALKQRALQLASEIQNPVASP